MSTQTDVDPLERLAHAIRSREATVAVVGLGYVGLPLLAAVHSAGFDVVGLDTDQRKLDSLAANRSYVVDVSDAAVEGLVRATFTTDPGTLRDADIVVLCLPTPLSDGAPDLSGVKAASEDAAKTLAPGMLVVLESTTYPGTTEEVVRPILESTGLVAGVDFALAYSPERIDPGRAEGQLTTTPKIVSGLTERCRDLAVSFYGTFVSSVVTTKTIRDAEMAKLIENTYRQVNIALVNELAVMAGDLGVDIWEALHAAATKPFGYQPFWPGPGVGGHCIAIDPTYLSWRAGQRLGYRIGFIEHANEVNNRMPGHVAAKVMEALNEAGKPVKGSSVLAIGVAFKPGVDDLRGSPALAVLERLAAKGADVRFHDPFVASIELGGETLSSSLLDPASIADADVVVILTPHPGLDVHAVVRDARLVFDARGATFGIDAPNVRRL